VSLKVLAARHGWPWRNVYRDVEALDRAGFPVETIDGRHRLTSGWNTPHLPGIANDEILALYAIRAATATWRATALGRPLDRLWMKLTATTNGQGALIPMAREPWFAVRSPVAIDYRTHDKIIATFDRATRDKLAVTCRYRALSTRETTARTIEPGELYWDPALESLYVIGWCRLREGIRVFAVHRFLAASLTDERFASRQEARSKAALRGAFRIWRGKNVVMVRVRFAPDLAEEIRERTWGPGQRVEEEAGGGLVLTLEVAAPEEMERWVLGFGPGAEVLQPAGLRDRIAVRARAAAGVYGATDGLALGLSKRRPPLRRSSPGDVLSRRDNRRG